MCQARRYERTDARKDCRAGFYQRKLQTQAGPVELNVPKLRHAKFETAIIERYRRRESSVEEALMEMYLAGVSVRRVEDITEALWGMRVSAGTVSDLNQKLYERIDQWRNAPIVGTYPYVHLDGICLKRSWAGEVRNVSVLVAVGGSGGRAFGISGGSWKARKKTWRAGGSS
jgi:putative transposase